MAQLLLFAEELAVEPHVEEALRRHYVVAILQMVASVEGVGHKQHIITGVLSAHGVVADDYTPMSALIHVFYHDRGVLL